MLKLETTNKVFFLTLLTLFKAFYWFQFIIYMYIFFFVYNSCTEV